MTHAELFILLAALFPISLGSAQSAQAQSSQSDADRLSVMVFDFTTVMEASRVCPGVTLMRAAVLPIAKQIRGADPKLLNLVGPQAKGAAQDELLRLGVEKFCNAAMKLYGPSGTVRAGLLSKQ
jgi:hypothetical protein